MLPVQHHAQKQEEAGHAAAVTKMEVRQGRRSRCPVGARVAHVH